MSTVFSIAALLLGSGLLLMAGGLHGLLLPVRGLAEGFSDTSLGMLGAGWAAGYIAGCLLVPMIVKRVGHIRTFGVMASIAAISMLLNLLFMMPEVWIPLRALTGFCFAGGAMIVESWLNERANNKTRGRVFGIYTMINLGSTTIGQMLLTLGDPTGFVFFVVGSIIYSLSLLPTALSTAATPTPLTQARLDPRQLWKNSPVAVVAVVLTGISNGAFGTLGAVYGRRIGLEVGDVAIMMSLSLLIGALIQVPVGMVSDRIDRRLVLIGMGLVAMVVEIVLSLLSAPGSTTVIIFVSLFGGMIYSMYPVIVAHANDHAAPGEFLKTSGGLLMLYGVGTMIGPIAAAALMSATSPSALFHVTAGAHLLMVLFTLWRMTQRASLSVAEKSDFVPVLTTGRLSTPETAAMDPRSDEEQQKKEAAA
ncbi:MFS transporter [Pannonibacter sp. Q-1]|uniref:MFS transporter n=1 Tax=Pannonibacter phragmitetus TaxID=121719 RepID=A0A0L0J3M4_9HYPH|nr:MULTISPECIES: MFS transporter [Pannonibacter]ALV26229.1 MFS transporter [Pannonibacter phragmitetus]KND20237.1 MFS transporter [Pannonibacter phragmitetus]MBA4206077.1 MFS transporter [Polymorphum sp.]